MSNGEECIVWNTLKGMCLSSRSKYEDLIRAGVKHDEKIAFIAFVPHMQDLPVFLDVWHYKEIVSTPHGRYFIADSMRKTTNG